VSPQTDTPHRTLDARQRRQAAAVLVAMGAILFGLISSVDHPGSSLSYDRSGYGSPDAALPRQDGDPATQPVVVTVPVPVAVRTPVAVSGPVQRILIPVSNQPAVRGVIIEPRPANGPASPEITRFYVETERPSVGERTRFRWWAGDADGQLRGYVVDFGDGHEARNLGPDRCMAQPSDPVQERPPFDYTYDTPGRYTVTITIYTAGSCGNGPTQTATAELTFDVGVFGVGTSAAG